MEGYCDFFLTRADTYLVFLSQFKCGGLFFQVGVIIGKSGETIKYLQLQSGAKIQVTRDAEVDPSSQTRTVELMGTTEQVNKAEQLINDVLKEVLGFWPGGSLAFV